METSLQVRERTASSISLPWRQGTRKCSNFKSHGSRAPEGGLWPFPFPHNSPPKVESPPLQANRGGLRESPREIDPMLSILRVSRIWLPGNGLKLGRGKRGGLGQSSADQTFPRLLLFDKGDSYHVLTVYHVTGPAISALHAFLRLILSTFLF